MGEPYFEEFDQEYGMLQQKMKDILQKNGFTDYDFKCPLPKTIGMMRVIVGFHEAAQKAIAESTGESKIGWNMIYNSMKDIIVKITSMKFEMPGNSDEYFKNFFTKLYEEVLQDSAPWLRRC